MLLRHWGRSALRFLYIVGLITVQFFVNVPTNRLRQARQQGQQYDNDRTMIAEPLLSCSWSRPLNDSINYHMNWSSHHFETLYRRRNSGHKVSSNTTAASSHDGVEKADDDNEENDCPERRLWNEVVPYYIYPQRRLFTSSVYHLEHLVSNNLSQNPMVMPEYHRIDAQFENYIFQALFHSKVTNTTTANVTDAAYDVSNQSLLTQVLRVNRYQDAQLCIVPIPFGTIYFNQLDTNADKQKLYNEILTNLRKAEPYRQGIPHVLVSMTNPIFDFRRVQYVQFGKSFYDAVDNMTVARGDDHYAARYAYLHHVTPNGDSNFHGFERRIISTTQPVTQYTFSVGLGGQAMNLPLQVPTHDKFYNASSLFLFYHTRAHPPFISGSGEFRMAPIENVSWSSNALMRANNSSSSVGLSIPWKTWKHDIMNSKFCLVMRGDTPHSHSLFSAVKVGCIPVVVSDWYPFYAPPFPSTLDMRDFCIFIAEDDFIRNPEQALVRLHNIDDNIIQEKLKALQWAQRVMIVDHPNSLFVPAFIREAFRSFSRPKSNLSLLLSAKPPPNAKRQKQKRRKNS